MTSSPLSDLISWEKLRAERIQLALHLHASGLDMLLFDKKSNELKALRTVDTSNIPGLLKELAKVPSPFQSVSVTIMSPLRTLIPNGLYDQDTASDLLASVVELPRTHQVHSDQIESIDSQLVYAYHSDVVIELTSIFPTIRVRHGMSILLEAARRSSGLSDGAHTLAHFDDGHMEVLIMVKRRPLFFNVFIVENETDVAYHLLHTFELLDIEHTSADLAVAGDIDVKGETYELLSRYCPALRLATPTLPKELETGLDKESSARHLILLDLLSCA